MTSWTYITTGKTAANNFLIFFKEAIDKRFFSCYNSGILIKGYDEEGRASAFTESRDGGNRHCKCSDAHHFRAGGSKDFSSRALP